MDSTLPSAAIEAVALVIRCGMPHDGSDCDEAVDQDAERALRAALPHMIDDAMIERATDVLHEHTNICAGADECDSRAIAEMMLRAALGAPR